LLFCLAPTMVALIREGRSDALPFDRRDKQTRRTFARVGISYQIGLVGLLGVVGLLLVGCFYYYASTELAASNRRLERANFVLSLLDRIKIDLLEARRSEKDFLLRRNQGYAKKQADALDHFERDRASLADLIGDASRALIAKMAVAIAQYQRQFRLVVDTAVKIGVDENSGLQGTLRQSVHDIERTIVGDADVRLEAAMLTMRRHEKVFFARLDRQYLDEMREASARFSERLGQSNLPADHKEQIAGLLAFYQRDFAAAAASSLEQVEAIARLSKLYADAEPIVDQMDTLVREQASKDKTAAGEVASHTMRLMGSGIALLSAAVAVLSLLVGGSVSRRLTGMVRLVNRLAEGDLTIEVKGADRNDAVGMLARALRVFKENALKARVLESERRSERERKKQRQKAIEAHIAEFDGKVREALDRLASAATEMRATAESMSAIAEETQRQSVAVSESAEQTSASIQTVAASSEEMAGSVEEIDRRVTQVSGIAHEAVQQAHQTNVAVNTLAETTHRIGQVLQLVQDIASHQPARFERRHRGCARG
jgi:methyl-accepting chemotaxis protein